MKEALPLSHPRRQKGFLQHRWSSALDNPPPDKLLSSQLERGRLRLFAETDCSNHFYDPSSRWVVFYPGKRVALDLSSLILVARHDIFFQNSDLERTVSVVTVF